MDSDTTLKTKHNVSNTDPASSSLSSALYVFKNICSTGSRTDECVGAVLVWGAVTNTKDGVASRDLFNCWVERGVILLLPRLCISIE